MIYRMEKQISKLEPAALWSLFAEILKIPRSSGHEEKIAEWILDFAKVHGIAAIRDLAGNLILKVPPSPGREHSPSVLLQGHLDMVAVAAPGVVHDFLHDPIDAYIDEGWLKARGTTLGADDGLGLATALALLADPTLQHGPLGAIFTTAEETTMKGATSLDPRHLDADYLVNIDSEINGYLYVSCAGSCDLKARCRLTRVPGESGTPLQVILSGCCGGHSGTDIGKGGANAITLLCSLLSGLASDFEFGLGSIDGGTVRNAIPSECRCTLMLSPKHDPKVFAAALTQVFSLQQPRYDETDPDLKLEIRSTGVFTPATVQSTLKLLKLAGLMPQGVLCMSKLDPEVVETSSNPGVISTTEDEVSLCTLLRSLKEQVMDKVIARVSASCNDLGDTQFTADNRLPCWDSPSSNGIITALNQAFLEVSGRPFKISAIHAGLECAVFARCAPHLQLVSVGPTIISPHSPEERADIAGASQIYQTLRRTLAAL